MKAVLFALSAGSLLGSALGLNARHAALHQKKDMSPLYQPVQDPCCKTVVTVTVWDNSEPTPEPVHQTTTYTSTSTSLQVVTVSAEKPSSTPSPPATGGGIPTNGNKWAFTYTAYDTNGNCLDAGTVATQVSAIAAKGFTTLRLYGTDCNTLSSVGPAARAAGLKLILGVFIKSDGIAAAQSQVGDITAWGSAGNWDLVVMVVVGNEALQNGYCNAGSLAGFISSTRGALVGAGLPSSVPFTTAETVASWGAHTGDLCAVVDVVGVNIQTFFDGKVVAANAGSFVLQMFEQVVNFCPGKAYYNLESGWPSGGGNNGASIASPEAQAAAMADIAAKSGKNTVMFSFQNDAWKAGGVEQHFGCIDLF